MKKRYQAYGIFLVVAALGLGGCGQRQEIAGTGKTSAVTSENVAVDGTAAGSSAVDNGDTQGETQVSVNTREESAESAPVNGESENALYFESLDIDQNPVTSEIFAQSKLTMVNVWATYCGPCLHEMPDLGELAREYDPAEFQLIGIVSDVLTDASAEDVAYARELIQETGADYTHLLLNESLYTALLTEVSAVPTTFFINENGEILDTVIGAMEKSAWEEIIHEFLEES